MWRPLVALVTLAGFIRAELTGCAGYVEQPEGVKIKLKDLKVQLFLAENNKLLSETEVARSTGFFHVSFSKQADVVLRLVAPEGWIFQENEIRITIDGNDKCSNNEDILFYMTGFQYQGRIKSLGSELGPSGISVTLTGKSGATFITETSRDGVYAAGPMFPGEYTISAKHPRFSLSAPIQVELDTDTVIRNSPSVIGYQIPGHVSESGSPVENVRFELFESESGNYVGHTFSAENGEFIFEKIAVGSYNIKASFVDETTGTVFSISPVQQTVHVNVENENLEVQQFRVTGLNIKGRVLDFSGNPLSGAKVLFDNVATVESDDNGFYEIENVTPGNHQIKISKEHLEFETKVVNVATKNPKIDDLKPIKVAVCPHSNGDEIQIEVFESQSNSLVTSSVSGKCVFLPDGDFILKPILNKHHYTPTS